MVKDAGEHAIEKELRLGRDPVLVYFWAPWGEPCRLVDPTIQKISDEYQGRIRVLRVNIEESKELAALLGVKGIPTVMLFVAGRLRWSALGVRPRAEYLRMLLRVLEEGATVRQEDPPVLSPAAQPLLVI